MTLPPRVSQALTWLGVAVLALATGWLWTAMVDRRHPLEGRVAPDFSLRIIAGEGADERDLAHLAALRGQVVLLDFWATWCGPCRASIPILSRLATRFRDRDVVVLGVDVGEARLPDAALRLAHQRFGSLFPTVADRSGEVQEAYRVDTLPTLVLIDRGGTVRGVEVGVPDEDTLANEINDLLD